MMVGKESQKPFRLGLLLLLVGGSFGILWWFRNNYSRIRVRTIAFKHPLKKLRNTSTLGTDWNTKIDSQYKDKCVGCIIGLTCGDILGSNLEGEHPRNIQQYGTIHSFASHKYTDDTEMTLALMESIISKGYLSAQHCSENYGRHYLARPSRGYGKSAKTVLKALGTKSTTHTQSGYLVNSDGSWANGGAMRIAPVALCFRNASQEILLKATEAAVMCTHRHPVGIDGAYVQAILVSYCANNTLESFSWETIISKMISSALTDEVKDRLQRTKQSVEDDMDNLSFAESLENERGSLFQIRASDCVASVAFIVGKYYKEPEIAVQQAVSLGGDTDTIACMVGACVGALHGSSWIPKRWFQNIENSKTHGRHALINCALQLSEFNFSSAVSVVIED